MAGFMISMVSAQTHGQLPALVLWVADQPFAALVSCRFWLFLLRRHLGFGARFLDHKAVISDGFNPHPLAFIDRP
jgi:hypothetical protein